MLLKIQLFSRLRLKLLFSDLNLMAVSALFLPLTMLIMQGCTHQVRQLDIAASKLGFSRNVVAGNGFKHVVYIHNDNQNSPVLHVYLDGDGRPWIRNQQISSDPTPENPMMLKLMAMDPASSLYLGRPCYHGFSSTPPCNPELWTSARYSIRIVESMQRVLLDYMAQGGYSEIVLIGHSGGGTLAMLLAGRISATRAVVTIAGNLDIDAWTEYHGYSPLIGSLNPVHMPQLDAGIKQYHLIGKADTKLPYHLVEQALQNQTGARVQVWDEFDHACCWHRIWSEFLPSLDSH